VFVPDGPHSELWPRSLLWRTVLLLALLLGVSQLTWVLLSDWSEREMRRQIGDYAVAMTAFRGALPHRWREPRPAAGRSSAQAFASFRRGSRLSPRAHRLRSSTGCRQIHAALGESTMVVLDRRRPRAMWISVDLAGERYWVVLSRTRVERPFPWRWFGWGAVVLAVSVAGAYLIVYRISRPLRRLTRPRHPWGGETPRPVLESGPAELRALTHTFNR
jgi:two-component system osmolarity sensor histidine kinase EnvZ